MKALLLGYVGFMVAAEWNTISVPPPLYYYKTISLTGDAAPVTNWFRVAEDILAVCVYGGGIGIALAFIFGGFLDEKRPGSDIA